MKKLLLVVVFLLWSFNAHATNFCISDAKGCWLMTEGSGTSAADRTGLGNTGTFLGSGTPAWNASNPSFGITGSAAGNLSFSGTTGYVNVGSGSTIDNLDTQGGGGMTIVFWYYPVNKGEAGFGSPLYKNNTDTGNTGSWQIYHNNNDQQLVFAKDYATTDLAAASSTTMLTLNTWQHIAITWDGSTTATNVHIYKNGTEDTKASTTNGSGTKNSDAAQSLYIGNAGDDTLTVNGRMAEVAVFARVLTSTEIGLIYKYGLTGGSDKFFQLF